MRSWYPIPPSELDNKALLGEHNEILIMLKTIAGYGKGWQSHPETLRWKGHTKALKVRHDNIALEMLKRGYKHKSPIPEIYINQNDSIGFPDVLVEPLEIMYQKLEQKKEYRKMQNLFRFMYLQNKNLYIH